MPDQSANARYRTTDPTEAEVPYRASANRRLSPADLSYQGVRLTDLDQGRARRIVAAIERDPAWMMRALLRLHRHHQRWPWHRRKQWMDLIRHMERAR